MQFNRTNNENEHKRILAPLQHLFMKQLALPFWKSSQHNYDNHEIEITHSSRQNEKKRIVAQSWKAPVEFFQIELGIAPTNYSMFQCFPTTRFPFSIFFLYIYILYLIKYNW